METPKFEIYEGPENIIENITAVYTDSARVKARVKAPQQEILRNGDNEYTKGMNIKFFDENEELENTLTCEYAIKDIKTGIWTIRGNVIITNIKKNEKLNTEELYWNASEDRIWTEKFVRIETEDQILTGTGLESDQRFSEYEILNPRINF
jgi:LPS export ABC transporter protein LptC